MADETKSDERKPLIARHPFRVGDRVFGGVVVAADPGGFTINYALSRRDI